MTGGIKLELISPAAEDNAPFSCLSLATLAALTPPDVEVSFSDDLIRPVDPERNGKYVDLVGITCTSKTAPRAYEIASSYRDRGIPVVMGGVHPTAVPEEALEHCDSVLEGEAEGVWPRLISDFKRGNLGSLYSREGFADPKEIPKPRRSLFYSKDYFPLDPIQATRGCPYLCDFCSVRRFFGGTYRYRSVRDIVEEIQSLPHRLILFADDNIVGHPGYSKRLLEAMVPLKKRWVGQGSLAGLGDESMVKLMAKSGCVGLLIGFESVSEESIKGSRKFQNHPSDYMRIIRNLHKNGIAVWASFMFGLDHDDKGIFERAVRFAIDAKFFSVAFAILNPYPGTDLYDRLRKENRLTNESWWLQPKQEEKAPHFYPLGMTRQELFEGWQWAWKEYYSYASILKRFQWEYRPTLANKFIYFPFNIVQHRFVARKILKGERLAWTKLPWKKR